MYKYFLLFLFIIISDGVQSQQIVNDECSTAVELFLFPFTTGNQHCDNAVPEWIGGDNIFQYASPSEPYYSMTGCHGYSNTTIANSEDIWFKYKGSTPSRDIWLDSDDSMNIAFYHGTDCGSLLPSGCFTYVPSYYDTIIRIFTSSDTLEFNFIQISSVGPDRGFSFNACVYEYGRPNLVLPFGTIQISTNLDRPNGYSPIYLFPNPFKNTINFVAQTTSIFDFNLFDIYGRKLKSYSISGKIGLDLSDLLPGIYYYEMLGLKGRIKTGTLLKE